MGVPPGTAGATNDDIVFPPGGFTYSANVHQAGQLDWPQVEQTEATLWHLTRIASITYRSYLETKAGETRNDIFFLKITGFPSLDPLKATYESANLPEGFTLEQGRKWMVALVDKTRKRPNRNQDKYLADSGAGDYTSFLEWKLMVSNSAAYRVPWKSLNRINKKHEKSNHYWCFIGIGKELAKIFASNDYEVGIAARRTDLLKELATEMQQKPTRLR